ncbi:fibronectin type III domain-containing protein, partial [Paenibacillus sp. UY79]|nr:fibronectin type III domain-containing protein [Paenibacillus farraposensis]
MGKKVRARWASILFAVLFLVQFQWAGGIPGAFAADKDTILSASSDYGQVLVKRGDAIYANERRVSFSWVRNDSFSAKGYSFSRYLSASGTEADVQSAQFGSYTSDYTGYIPHAFVVSLDKIYFISSVMEYKQNGMEVGKWTRSSEDAFGLQTPRNVYSYETPVKLVINADTGVVVDLASQINPYYKVKPDSSNFNPTANPTIPTELPLTPTNITAIVSGNNVQLKWLGAANAMQYEVEQDGTVVKTLYGNQYSAGNLKYDTAYSFRIRSKNNLGVSEWSEPFSARTLLSIPLLRFQPLSEANQLNWEAVTGAESYEIKLDGGAAINVGNVTSYLHEGLKPSSQHTYSIRAISSNNESEWSKVVNQTTLPAGVEGLNITGTTNKSITLAWSAVSGATSYEVEVDGVTVPVNNLTYTTTGLEGYSEHTFRVRAKNAAGVGAWSKIVTGVTLLNTPVAKATSTTSAITLSWEPIAGAGSYEVEADGVIQPAVTETSFTHSGLSAGTSHKYRVRAKTDKNTSAWSTLQTQATLPAEVTGLAVSGATNTTVALKWTAVTGATGYDLEV